MYLRQAAHLAWANTTDDLNRLLVRCAGITFAVLLMFMQTGFRNALFDSNVRLAEKIQADLVVRTKSRFMLSSGQLMPMNKIVAAASVSGVKDVQPVFLETVVSHLRKQGQPARRIRVIAFDFQSSMFSDFGIASYVDQLNAPATAIADNKSKPMFRFREDSEDLGQTYYGELLQKRIRLVGEFDLGIDFSNDGNIIVSTANFKDYFPHRRGGTKADYGLIQLEDSADPLRVVAALRQKLGPYVIVQTKADFLQSERDFWGKSTPIGLIFNFGTLIGFVVGLIICYQVLATDIGDHLAEFATLKAMGFPASFFAGAVVFQALLMAIVSFLPGALMTWLIFQWVNTFSGLIMFLNFERCFSVLVLTMAMCIVSGVIALRKLLSSDPASLF